MFQKTAGDVPFIDYETLAVDGHLNKDLNDIKIFYHGSNFFTFNFIFMSESHDL